MDLTGGGNLKGGWNPLFKFLQNVRADGPLDCALNIGLADVYKRQVHDLRLQCLEYFNKFYEDGGRPFRPLMADTKYVDITK